MKYELNVFSESGKHCSGREASIVFNKIRRDFISTHEENSFFFRNLNYWCCKRNKDLFHCL